MGYNPNQLRVPAGNPNGGQWTSDRLNTVEKSAREAAGLGAKVTDYLPVIKSYNTVNGTRTMSDEEQSRVAERIKNMPSGIRKLEPIDTKYRTTRNLRGEKIVLQDEISVSIVDDIGKTNYGSAFAIAKDMYLAEEFIGTPVQDHEYIHTLVFRNMWLREALQSSYNPPYLFLHAKGAQDVMGEHFTMIMTGYSDNMEEWISNILSTESYNKRTRDDALSQINTVTNLLKDLEIW